MRLRLAALAAAAIAAVALTAGSASASTVRYQQAPGSAVYHSFCHTSHSHWHRQFTETCLVEGTVTGPSYAYVEANGNAPMATLTYYAPPQDNGFSVTECLALYPPLVNLTAVLAAGQRVHIIAFLTATADVRPDMRVSLVALPSIFVNPNGPPPTPGPCG